MDIETRAERKVLAALANRPELIFQTAAVLKSDDFKDEISRCLYRAITDISHEGTVEDTTAAIDEIVLEQKIASIFPEFYSREEERIRDTVIEVTIEEPMPIRDFKVAVNTVIRNAVARGATQMLERTKQEVSLIDDHKEIVSFIESEVFDFTTGLNQGDDIVVLGNEYERFMAQRAAEYEKGTLHIGIKTGFDRYDEAIGGGYRDGTVNVIAARSKMGKSWLALKIADYVCNDYPVLYLDTELEDNYQADRRCAQTKLIPIHLLENYEFSKVPKYYKGYEEAKERFQKYPIYYVDIKGWSIDRIISVIRKFFAKHVKRKADGKYNRALVIYDYFKLMRSQEKGRDTEWETLGYRMTLLHDLMGSYNNPMLALAQQNRDGLEKEDESTVSGSDRIIWLCDNFSLLIPISPVEVAAQQEQVEKGEVVPIDGQENRKLLVYNTKLKVVVSRHGPGTRNGYIATYMDIHDAKLRYDEVCGHIEEGPRRIIQRKSA